MSAHPSRSRALQETIYRLRSNQNELILLDGGTGEELFRRGVPDDRKIWSATALVKPQYHDTLRLVHRAFFNAGADAITTNSYGVVPGVGFSLEDIQRYVSIAGGVAREAAREIAASNSSKHPLVFGSMGPLIESYRPDKIMPHDEGVTFYRAIAKALSPHVDAFLAETMSCVEEASQAVDAVGQLGDELFKPLFVSFTLDGSGMLRNGESVLHGISKIMEIAEEKTVDLLGILFNCAEPESITQALENIQSDEYLSGLLKSRAILLGAYANRLTPVSSNWTIADSASPQPFRSDIDPREYHDKFVSYWVRQLGVVVVGGCCGITPEHISHLNESLRP